MCWYGMEPTLEGSTSKELHLGRLWPYSPILIRAERLAIEKNLDYSFFTLTVLKKTRLNFEYNVTKLVFSIFLKYACMLVPESPSSLV